MKKFAALALCAVVSAEEVKKLALVNDTAVKAGERTWDVEDSDPSDLQYEGRHQWRCGNALQINGEDNYDAKVWHNANAGIAMLKEYSLDHVRLASTAPSSKTFEDLFCKSYIRKYKNPNHPGHEGVCIRNAAGNAAEQWESILEADREAEETFKLFETKNGYQRTASKYKDLPVDGKDFQTQWGSGAEGPNPNNWCSAYMQEMICHVAFPQFAGNETDLTAERVEGATPGYLAPVRPVGRGECESMMDNCNRHEPVPYTGVVSWLVNTPFINPDQALDNVLYCDAWNRGFGLAKAGCGVAAGDDEDEEEFVATWDASSSLTPMGLLAVAATLVAALQ